MRVFPFLILILLADLCGPPRSSPQGPAISEMELAIIVAAVDSLYVRAETRRIVIQSPTDTLVSDAVRAALGRLEVSPALAADLARRNMVSVDLRGVARLLGTRVPIVFVSKDSLRRLPRSNPDIYWRAFFASFSGSDGLLTVSRPGIDAGGQTAVVYIGQGCGGLCGSWGYAILRNRGDRWQVTRYVVTRTS